MAKKIKNSFFNIETAKSLAEKLKEELEYPFVSVRISTLGGDNNVTIMLAYSTEPKESWINNIFENSKYRRFSIYNDGTVENFVTAGLSHVRKFTAKDFDHLVTRLNKK